MDIKEEFESIFGVTIRPSLFDADDAEYQQLRQQIINAPKELYQSGALPFEGICLPSFRKSKTIPNHTAPIVQTSKPVKEIASLISQMVDSLLQSKKHIFFLKIPGVCNASGYYVKEDNRFVVLKGSRFSKMVSPSFASTPLGVSRGRFIEAACIDQFNEFVVKEDTRCKSPSAASSYLQGKAASYVEWIDSNGKYLKDFYPERFVQTATSIKPVQAESKLVISEQLHIFYIKRENTVGRDCDAFGYYDPNTQKFVIRSGSILALEMAATYKYSAAGITRRNILNKFCAKESKGYRLRKDKICDSPSAAAALVMGGSANGWDVWKDVHGRSLDMVYRQ